MKLGKFITLRDGTAWFNQAALLNTTLVGFALGIMEGFGIALVILTQGR